MVNNFPNKMRNRIIVLSLLLVLLAAVNTKASKNDAVFGERHKRAGYDRISAMILTKLEDIEERLTTIELRLNQRTSRKFESEMVCSIQKDGKTVTFSATKPTESSVVSTTESTSQITASTVVPTTESTTKIEQRQEIKRIVKKPEADKSKIYNSCRDVPSRVSGIYKIKMWNDAQPISVLCEMDPLDPGWIVVQNRFNGSELFYRNWTDYEAGFGSLNGEFWLGLENMSALVNNGRQWEIKFLLQSFQGVKYHAKYTTFLLGDAASGYELKQANIYTGNAGDSFKQHLGMKFSTYDRDNDLVPNKNCAEKHRGGWWYHRQCVHSNLNALYGNVANEQSNCWHTIRPNWIGLQASKMMIRELR